MNLVSKIVALFNSKLNYSYGTYDSFTACVYFCRDLREKTGVYLLIFSRDLFY